MRYTTPFRTFFLGLALAALVHLPQVGKSAETINMLALDTTSGGMKNVGDRLHYGIKFAVEEINAKGGLLGSQIKVFYDDSQLKPDVASRKVLRYVAEENVKFIMSGTGTHISKAMTQVAEKEKIIMLNYGAVGDELTGRDFSRYHFRSVLSAAQQSGALAAYFANTPYNKYYILCQDYAAGYAQANAFKSAMSRFRPGWELVGEGYHPVGTKDLGPYITKVNASGAEVLISGNWGIDLLTLIKQGAGLGLKAKIGSYFLADPTLLATLGDAAVGHIAADIYMLTEDTLENRDFIKRWRERKMDPEYPYPAHQIGKSYLAFMFLAEAIRKAKSVDAEEVIKAWEGLEMKSIVGPLVMRACDHQVITPISVAEVRKGPGEYYQFPFVGKPTVIAPEKGAVPPGETGNPRCK